MIPEEESLGMAAEFNIAEFIVIISQLCMDRHSDTPSTPNFSSLPIPTLARSHRPAETRLKEEPIPPNHISFLRIQASLYAT
jgi:hypothetical protein